MPRRAHAFVLVSLLGTSLACGALSGNPTAVAPTLAQPTRTATAQPVDTAAASTNTPSSPPTAEASVTPLPISTQPGELTIEVPIVFGAGPFIYTDTQTGLAALTSYTAQLVVTFAGTRDGQPEQWTATYAMLASNDPPARQWTIETTGDVPQPGIVTQVELAGTDYERRGEAACTASAIEEGNSLAERMELAAFLTGVIGADEAGAETISGVAAAHYTFDQRALGEDGLAASTGELWVAAEGGYLVQYRLSSQGGAGYFEDGVEGTLTLDYTLTGVNQPVAISVPDDCPPGLLNVPLLPDASEVEQTPGLLAYATASDVSAVVDFYEAQLPSLGWAADGEPAVTSAATLLSYTQGDRLLTVHLSRAGDTTKVTIAEVQLQP